jgi:hypothetical protein
MIVLYFQFCFLTLFMMWAEYLFDCYRNACKFEAVVFILLVVASFLPFANLALWPITVYMVTRGT